MNNSAKFTGMFFIYLLIMLVALGMALFPVHCAHAATINLKYSECRTIKGQRVCAPAKNVCPPQQPCATATPAPVPTTAPTPKPTPVPTPIPTVTPIPTGFANATEWPGSFRPYGDNSPWNTVLPDNAKKYVDSDAIVAKVGSQPKGTVIRTSEAGQYDYTHPVYFASNTDPLLNAKCTLYCNGDIPSQIRVPAKARPAGGGDSHMAVIQPDGTEVDMWGVSKPSGDWQSGQTISFLSGGRCGNFYTGSGFRPDVATAGNACLAGGIVRPAELEAGEINHALFLVVSCVASNAILYPATWYAYQCSDGGKNVPIGARVQLTLTESQIDALNVSRDQKTILKAMHKYGGYVMDTNASNTTRTTSLLAVSMVEGSQAYVSFGKANPFDIYAQQHGWTGVAISGTSQPRYFSPDNWGIDLGAYVQIVDPCYARGTCN